MQLLGIASDYKDLVTASNATAPSFNNVFVPKVNLSALNTNVTTTTASSLAVEGPPNTGTNQTITNAYALFIQSGSSFLGGTLILGQIGQISGTPSTTTGGFIFVNGNTYTDTSTAASGTATGFNGTYFAAPTLRATNTGVTTTTASTVTIAGPPIAGTNETISTAYALNVLSGLAFFGGTSLFSNNTVTATQQQYIGRFYLTSSFSPPAGTWSYFPSQFAVAGDLPPSIRATVSATNTGTTLNYNSSTGLIFLPVSGRYAFNIWYSVSNGSSTTNHELRLYTYSAPAWPAAGSVAKSAGPGQTASTLSGTYSAALTTTSYVSYQENGLSYIGEFPATTLIAPLIYNSPQLTFNVMYIEVRLLTALT